MGLGVYDLGLETVCSARYNSIVKKKQIYSEINGTEYAGPDRSAGSLLCRGYDDGKVTIPALRIEEKKCERKRHCCSG